MHRGIAVPPSEDAVERAAASGYDAVAFSGASPEAVRQARSLGLEPFVSVEGSYAGAARALGGTVRWWTVSGVAGYDAVHDVYAANGWPEPSVSVASVPVDALLARERGVGIEEVAAYLRACRRRERVRLASLEVGIGGALRGAVARWTHPRAGASVVREVYASARERKLDHLTVAGTTPDEVAVRIRIAHLQAPRRPVVVTAPAACLGEAQRACDEGIAVAAAISR